MHSEPLAIHNKKFLVNRLIQQAPTGTLVREFFKNADESAALAPLGGRRIEIYPVMIDGIRKLAFWNTGPGMDAEELKRATDLSSSINKTMSLEANFGIGAKVSGLTASPFGIRYRSCKTGVVHEVVIGYDHDEETYVRFPVELSDGHTETVYDVTVPVLNEGMDTSFDWTEVVLFGEDESHDTVSAPLGRGKILDRSYIATAIFRRFVQFSEGVEVRIDTAMTKGGGKDEMGRKRQLKTLGSLLDKLGRHEMVRDAESGVAVHFIHDPKSDTSSHTLSARANPATASTTFCALVHDFERYDFKTKQGWSAAAPKFGIPFGSTVLTVEIYVPDGVALPNQYRDGLTWREDRSAMIADDFADIARRVMPEWVKEIVRAQSPESDDNLDDLQSDLQKLLDEFRVPTVAMSPSRKLTAAPTTDDSDGEPTAELRLVGERRSDSEAADDRRHEQAASKNKVRRAPEGAQASAMTKALERVPEITILTDPEEVAAKSITGRAGCYYKETQLLFVNGLYPVVQRMARDLELELTGSDSDPEQIRAVAIRAAQRFMAFRVGKAACYAISKKLADHWSMDDLDKATTPESLSMAADDYHQSVASAKRWAKEQLRSATVEELAAG